MPSYEVGEWEVTNGAASSHVPAAGREALVWGHAGNVGTRVSEMH